MPRFFKLKASRTELYATHGVLALAAALTCIHIDHALVRSIFLLGIVILAIAETNLFRLAGCVYLCIDGNRCGLVSQACGQSYFSAKNKVYRTRWFAILKLCYRRKNENVMLLPDRFESLREYQDCRYLLTNRDDG